MRKEQFCRMRLCPIKSLADFCCRIFGSPRGSAALARERLRVIILCDRAGLSKAGLENLKSEMAAVARKYLDIDPLEAAVEIKRCGDARTVLTAVFPLRGGNSC